MREELHAIGIPDAEGTRARWSDQAGGKPPEDGGKPVVPSPFESGSSV